MGCVTCNSKTECVTCDPDKTIRDGLCKCDIGSYIDSNDACQLCSDAINFCA